MSTYESTDTSGHRMNKEHGITVDLSANFDDAEFHELADEIDRLVFDTNSKRLWLEISAE